MQRLGYYTLGSSLLVILMAGGPLLAQDRFVSLEAYTGQREAIGATQQWMAALGECGIDRVRVKTSAAPPQIKIEEEKSGRSSSIYVIGRIQNGKLSVPGRSFSMKDTAGIRAYFLGLKQDGADVALAEKKAFGLTSKQLVEVHEQLSATIKRPTKGEPTSTLLSQLLGQQRFATEYDNTARKALGGSDKVTEELQGLSIGTGIAAIIRPLGLVLQPRRTQGKAITLNIVAFDSAAENWPIGWPNKQPTSRIAPSLSKRLDLEIRGFTLEQTMNALEGRVGIPFLYDQNGMARQEIDPATAKVTFVKKKVTYIAAIGKMLNQTRPRLKHEIRVDENGKPFLWIAPMRNR